MTRQSWSTSFGPRTIAVLGPTNTGKTHLAVERMLGHASGMIGLPLRLLAREIYDRIASQRGVRAVALITGEERIVPARAHYFVCTVEAMPLAADVEFLAVDEIQLAADPERGHVFTSRLLSARGSLETMFLGAQTMAPLVRRLLPDAEITHRERFSRLAYAGHRKLTRLPLRTAVVAFSAEEVYAIAELIRRHRGGAAVVMGSLSPRTRNAQVGLFQSGEVDFLVATDAIGMGLNMDVRHVAFAGLRKFDGRRKRWLHAHEVGQIAGRAGRHLIDGDFGETAACPGMDGELVEAVEGHRFEPVAAAQWRNDDLDFSGLPALMASLAAPPRRPELRASEDALDERSLRALAEDDDARGATSDPSVLRRLWEACQTPDFRKTTFDDHLRLVRALFRYLRSGSMRLPDDWMGAQFRQLDREDGEIDALSSRLSGVRTLAYLAHRPDWLADPGHWQARTRHLEDRLSDALHERLMARFVDRRTSALLRGLALSGDLQAGVSRDGAVTVEGHFVGRLTGIAFEVAEGVGALAQKALRAAAERAVGPEVARRLGALCQDDDVAFALTAEGDILWRGEVVAVLMGADPFTPRVRLLGGLGPDLCRARAARRLEAFLAAETARHLGALRRLRDAVADGTIRGLSRGIAWRLFEAGGVLARSGLEAEVDALSRTERRALRTLGVRIGAISLYLPELRRPLAAGFARSFALKAAPHWRPAGPGPLRLPSPPPSPGALSLRGLAAIGSLAVDAATLEALAGMLRAAPTRSGARALSDAQFAGLGWTRDDARVVLRELGWRSVGEERDRTLFRRRGRPARTDEGASEPSQTSPFAALSSLRVSAIPRSRRRRGVRHRAHA